MGFVTPIGFLVFNRPELTEVLFKAIARIKPERLFIIADGARNSEEEQKCRRVKEIVSRVDWDCEVRSDFSEENLGCGRRVSSGISWVFSQVEEALFLEDDTLPDPSFFEFCRDLLERYRHDTRIMQISGNNFQFGHRRTPYSYYFSKYPHCWGWASWRRAWQHYDYNMKSWPAFKEAGLLSSLFDDEAEVRHWLRVFDIMYSNPRNPMADTWDYQWIYTVLSQGGLSVNPNDNLVTNIGFGHADAVHTKEITKLSGIPLSAIREIRHPEFVLCHREADRYTFEHVFKPKPESLIERLRDKHFYGGMVRKVPVLGRLWRWWRNKRREDSRHLSHATKAGRA